MNEQEPIASKALTFTGQVALMRAEQRVIEAAKVWRSIAAYNSLDACLELERAVDELEQIERRDA